MTLLVNEKSRSAILELISESDTLKILRCIDNDPMSAQQIMKCTDLPYSTVYKKIKWMMENHSIRIHKIELSKERKKIHIYQSMISDINVTYENGEFNIDVQKK